MKKWIKRIIVASVVLLALAVAGVVTLNHLRNRRPDWYPSGAPDSAAIAAAARSMKDKFAGVTSWAAETHASERTQQSGREPVRTDPAAPPDRAKTVSLTAAELNAFFSQWDESQNWGDKYSQYLIDPVLVLQENRIILAARLKEIDTIASVHLEPRLDEGGQLHLTIAKIMGGSLPLPRAFWVGYRDKLGGMLRDKIEQERKHAEIAADGVANTHAVGASMNRLLLSALYDQPADPILFLPHDLSRLQKSAIPVKVSAVEVKDNTITLTIESLDAPQRKALLDRIRQPVEPKPDAVKTEKATGGGTGGKRESLAVPAVQPEAPVFRQ